MLIVESRQLRCFYYLIDKFHILFRTTLFSWWYFEKYSWSQWHCSFKDTLSESWSQNILFETHGITNAIPSRITFFNRNGVGCSVHHFVSAYTGRTACVYLDSNLKDQTKFKLYEMKLKCAYINVCLLKL